ncbi:hypothetical protein BDF20DRAFT_991056 [Mycotypha africana]|uniref:uncharacterized protein n=1 Tax=Mycotypha africana TaxID=64632 RepID=UPI0023006C1E|nr:uncharacterized protein BDF20DRAFT_991056 [Mycotypha africana]KAI8969262.1 hypothetical protein BDF20DRAFT_991056 [Mycotypha africana]
MEAFAPLPINLFADSDQSNGGGSNRINNRDDEAAAYFSLSQFDFELQQQAQAALLQQNLWQDFDKYLPMDSQPFNPMSNNLNIDTTTTMTNSSRSQNLNNNANILLRSREAESIFTTPTTATSAAASTAQSTNSSDYFNIPSANNTPLLYEPLKDLLPPNAQQPIVVSQHPSVVSTNSNFIENNNIVTTGNSSTLPPQPTNWVTKEIDNSKAKQDYASPESLPYSPPQNMQSTMSLSPPLPNSNQQAISFFQFPESASPTSESNKPTTTAASVIDTSTSSIAAIPAAQNHTTIPTTWNPSVTVNSSTEGTQAKLPIQRLKYNNSQTNGGSFNVGTNNSQPTSGRQQKKTAHNAIERRYRNNINDRIAELKNAVPALLYAKVKDNSSRSSNNVNNKRSHKGVDDEDDDAEDGEEYLDGVAVATKLNKATILRKATEYIIHLKKTGEDLRQENQTLQQILKQLPGGAEVLQQYLSQKEQREKMLQKQQLLERESQKQQTAQQRRAASRKRTKYNITREQDEYDSSSSRSSSTDPETPPVASNISNRVFMALFMCITFFSTSPLTSGGSSYSEQYRNHHHTSKANRIPSDNNNNPLNQASTTANSFNATHISSLQQQSTLSSFFSINDGWSTLRNVVFIICIIQVFLPYIKSMLNSSFRLKRVHASKTKNKKFRRGGLMEEKVKTAGELKCEKIYSILAKSLRAEGELVIGNSSVIFLHFMKECILLVCHHLFGFDVVIGGNTRNVETTPEEALNRVCMWIKLNELKCVGGDGGSSQAPNRLSMVYSCFRMINSVDTLSNDENDLDENDLDENVIAQLYSRAYATAAFQMSLVLPNKLAHRLSRYFWSCAVTNSKCFDGGDLHLIEGSDAMTEQSDMWMQSFSWVDPDLYEDDNGAVVYDVYNSQAWIETCEIIRNQSNCVSSAKKFSLSNLSLSYNAPVTVPMAILSNLHLLDNLRIQFDKLVVMFACQDEDDVDDIAHSNSNVTAFLDIILLTEATTDESMDNDQRLVNWLATVGLLSECLWRDELEEVEKHLSSLIHRIPRCMTCSASSNAQKELLNHLDETLKKYMIHILVGSTLLRNKDPQKQKQGLEELENGEALRIPIRKLQAKLRSSFTDNGEAVAGNDFNRSLEDTVMIQAEFAVAFLSLESWMRALDILGSDDNTIATTTEKITVYEERINEITLYLRRLIGCPALQNVPENVIIVDNLSRLNRFITYLGDADSACNLSEDDDNEDDDGVFKMNEDDILVSTASKRANNGYQSPAKIAEKAQHILRGHV